jgi:hypothetical protein
MLPNRNLGAGLVRVKIRPVSANLYVEPDAPWKIGLKPAYGNRDTKKADCGRLSAGECVKG